MEKNNLFYILGVIGFAVLLSTGVYLEFDQRQEQYDNKCELLGFDYAESWKLTSDKVNCCKTMDFKQTELALEGDCKIFYFR